ncbi:hypothetical protein CVT24_009723 [Panaeolus cyanescens]|uniref:G-protein coupled receptors family 1 profile domain-containing protein n=1 Tax=Panaeolus cyanescens TaxID=181874 RepID=A0A409Y9J9_9AGAR|nr:hypothetical protein CVT24_009723 [Panaeolus cyanescens]
MTAANNTFSAFSFITFILVIIPFPWHLEGIYIFLRPSKLLIGVSVAIPAASLCINRRLYCIASVQSVTRTRADKRRAILIDLAIGVGIPVLVMILHYVVQGHRFDIFEEFGCFPYTYNTWPAYPLVFIPPLILALISAVYCVLSIIQFNKRRHEFKEILSSNSNLTSNRYFRLMALASTDALLNIPMNLVVIILGAVRAEMNPYNWDDVHFDFGRVDLYPAVYWQSDSQTHAMMEATRWSVVFCGLLFFAFFGFGDEAQRHYKLAYNSIASKLGFATIGGKTRVGTSTSQGSATVTGTQTGTIFSFGNKLKGGLTSFGFSGLSSTVDERKRQAPSPIYISQEVVEKRDSLDSFRSELTSVKDFSDYAPSERGVSPLPSSSRALEQQTPNGLTPPRGRRASVPSSVTPSGSFLDLEDTKYNDDKV